MRYTVRTLPQISPKYVLRQGPMGPEPRLNPGEPVVNPSTFVGSEPVVRSKGFDVYSDDPALRMELWEDVEGTATPEEVQPLLNVLYDVKANGLWAAATRHQEEYISGVAIGLLTLGVANQLPKALACMQWNGDLWSEYYHRKAIIFAGGVPDYDFSSCGAMPFSVPELRAELGL